MKKKAADDVGGLLCMVAAHDVDAANHDRRIG